MMKLEYREKNNIFFGFSILELLTVLGIFVIFNPLCHAALYKLHRW